MGVFLAVTKKATRCVSIAVLYGSQAMEATLSVCQQMWCTYATEHYSAMEKSGTMPSAATWLDLQNNTERQIP